MIGALGSILSEVGAGVSGLSKQLFMDGFGLRLAIFPQVCVPKAWRPFLRGI